MEAGIWELLADYHAASATMRLSERQAALVKSLMDLADRYAAAGKPHLTPEETRMLAETERQIADQADKPGPLTVAARQAALFRAATSAWRASDDETGGTARVA